MCGVEVSALVAGGVVGRGGQGRKREGRRCGQHFGALTIHFGAPFYFGGGRVAALLFLRTAVFSRYLVCTCVSQISPLHTL